MSESAIVRAIIKKVRAEYPAAYVRKFADRHTRGLPDLVIMLLCAIGEYEPGRNYCGVLFVEAKTMYGRVGPLQVSEQNAILRAGGRAIFARSPEEVMNELTAMGAVR